MAAGSRNVWLFLRTGRQRLEDARVLLNDRRGGGAVYVGGYAVECGLKAALLASVPDKSEADAIASFRGAAAHDLEGLRERYYRLGGPRLPRESVRDFADVSKWGVALRYDPGTVPLRVAHRFVAASARLLVLLQNRSR